MTRGLRFWKSGCAAVISLALLGIGETWADDETDAGSSGWKTSRFDMAGTLQRLQACAPRHGLQVMAHWAPWRAADVEQVRAVLRGGLPDPGQSSDLVLVFAHAGGGTPVLMVDERATPDLPLSLRLRQRGDGLAEVLLRVPPRLDGQELPGELVRDLFELPGLVADAIG